MAAPPRLHWVDHAKAIGIVLVVVGHTSALPAEVREFIYRFHMPLFFFLAGVLTRSERLAEGFRPWLTRQTRALIIPFLGFFAISWVWWLLIRNIGDKAKESAGLAWCTAPRPALGDRRDAVRQSAVVVFSGAVRDLSRVLGAVAGDQGHTGRPAGDRGGAAGGGQPRVAAVLAVATAMECGPYSLAAGHDDAGILASSLAGDLET